MKSNYLHKKHFSIAEAIQVLFEYHSMIEKMKDLGEILEDTGFDFRTGQYYDLRDDPVFTESMPTEYQMLVQILEKLDSVGIVVKGIEEGLVDFPHLRSNGDEVYLCFQVGEETIQYWHSVDTGYSGRKPLTDLID